MKTGILGILFLGLPALSSGLGGGTEGKPEQTRTGPPAWTLANSPERHDDGTISFRIWAPEARRVVLESGELLGGPPVELARGDDDLWWIRVRPVTAGRFTYRFLVDGVITLDPTNSLTDGNHSLVWIPGKEADFYAIRDVPHGTVHAHRYHNETIEAVRRVRVYTPPGYPTSGDRTYPVLFLLHGSGETDESWIRAGRAHSILDNLIAGGTAQPMILVMPYGHTVEPGTHGWPFVQEQGDFALDFSEVLIPWLETRYRLSPRAEDWAVAGFSMGAFHALKIGLNHLDRFGNIGVFSWGGGREFFEEHAPAVLEDPEMVDRRLGVFFVACGREDFLFEGPQEMHELLDQQGIAHTFAASEGGHSMSNWRRYLRDLVTMLAGR